ncbi:MAG: CRISPR-associated endonuclease Cas2 [Treponema sp.]|nr:CRISPR-associated endonuclease Cas2 [Treponema sp.]
MKEKHYLIAYDITDDRRRRLIVKLLMNYAYRIQFSIFEFTATESIVQEIYEKVKRIIEENEDSVSIYELCSEDWNKRIRMGVNKEEINIYEQSAAII